MAGAFSLRKFRHKVTFLYVPLEPGSKAGTQTQVNAET